MAVRVLWTDSVDRQCSTPIGRTLKYVQNIATMLLHTHTKKIFFKPITLETETTRYQIMKGSLKKFASTLSVYTRPQQASLSQCQFDNRFN